MDRLVLVARLRPGCYDTAAQLVAAGPPFDPAAAGFARHTVYLTPGEAVFVFEAPEVEWLVGGLVDDPVISASFGAWHALIEGPPRLARELYAWERAAAPRATGEVA